MKRTAGDLPAWFENLLPEPESALRTRLCILHGLRSQQSFGLLLAVGSDLAGAVEVRAQSGSVRAANTALLSDGADTPKVRLAPEGGPPSEGLHLSPLAGHQLKFSMSMVNERLTLGAISGSSQWIVKFPGTDYPELSEVEAATMSWARTAGFDVPRHHVYPFDRLDGIPSGWVDQPAPVFVIERFDRRPDGTKVHHEDLCQALALRPANKFGESPGVSCEGALRLVTDTCGEEHGREMARRLGFAIASGNGDAHLKNWALLWGERTRPVLAPCYDLVATISWDRLGWVERSVPRLALKLAGKRRFSEIDETSLEQSVQATGHSWVGEEIRTGVLRARDAWRALEVSIPNRMRVALTEHWRRVPLLKRLGPLIEGRD